MWLPTLLLLLATLAGAVLGYGTDGRWAAVPHGVQIIEWSRRLEWPAAGASILLCVGVVTMVAAGRRRAWWLVGLLPVLVLFVHRFALSPAAAWHVADSPPLVSADMAGLQDEEWVVGLAVGGDAYAYPYAALFRSPVVVQIDRDHRLLLLWSAYANRAAAFTCDRSIVPAELDPVSDPADGLLIYNGRSRQFISGITGLTLSGTRPIGVMEPLQTWKMTWGDWRAAHPATRVVSADARVGPRGPLTPSMPLPKALASEPAARMLLVACTQPAAIDESSADASPVSNFMAGETHGVLLSASLTGGTPVAFDRQVKGDLFPKFTLAPADPKRTALALQDTDSQSLWTLDGKAFAGPLKGEQLRRLVIDNGLDLRVLRFWMPDLQVVTSEPAAIADPPASDKSGSTKPSPHHRKPKRLE